MPIYEYQCTHCQHKLEVLQKMSEAPWVECPACHHSTLKKCVSAAGFRLTGTGWYETDFKHKGKIKPEEKSTLGDATLATTTDVSKKETNTSSSTKQESASS